MVLKSKPNYIYMIQFDLVYNSCTPNCEGVIRDERGTWLRGFAKSFGQCNAFLTKLWGVFECKGCVRLKLMQTLLK